MIPEENIIVLSDEKGNGIQLEYLDTIEYEGHSYVVMTQGDSDEVIIMEQTVNDDGKSATYSDVLNDEVIAKVFDIFLKSLQ